MFYEVSIRRKDSQSNDIILIIPDILYIVYSRRLIASSSIGQVR